LPPGDILRDAAGTDYCEAGSDELVERASAEGSIDVYLDELGTVTPVYTVTCREPGGGRTDRGSLSRKASS
jgi:hypothetical protein